MTVAIDVRARYSQARTEVLRQGFAARCRADRCVSHRCAAASRLADSGELSGGLAYRPNSPRTLSPGMRCQE